MPLYEYQCPKCGRFELIRKFSDPPLTGCPTCGGEGPEAALRARHPVQGHGLVHHRLRAEVVGRRHGREAKDGAGKDAAKQGRRVQGRREREATRAIEGPSRTHSRQDRLDPAGRPSASALSRAASRYSFSDFRYSRNGPAQVRPLQRELHRRLQEAELVAGVVADALEAVAVDRPACSQQAPQPVGELDLAARVAGRRLQGLEDVGRQDVAADDGQVGGRLVGLRLLHQVADPVDAAVVALRLAVDDAVGRDLAPSAPAGPR